MIRLLSLAEDTLYAQLAEQVQNQQFSDDFPENGTFVKRKVQSREGAREYYYYQGYRPGEAGEKNKRSSTYVGPADDLAIQKRVQNFRDIKASRKESASLVNALIGAGLPRPPIIMGRVIEALAKAGVFRLRAVLVGTAAFQTYPAVLRCRISHAGAMTGDVDSAQFPSILIAVEDRTPPIKDILAAVDPTFAPVPHINDPTTSTAFANKTGFRLDILAAHRGSDEQIGRPVSMPALTGAAGEPLRFLDFLIWAPVRSVVLHGPGIAVRVPDPARFAVHKLIISTRRLKDMPSSAKARKDVLQAGEIIEAMNANGSIDHFKVILDEARERGPAWRNALDQAIPKLNDDARAVISALL
ncbi:GSU2403 family nucleotidyltransferase fold protein [Phreatobacter sp. AB_2022a]|uniref:GSU2403 family nucleotidyltransferase fold protein n=1 Tax=Phreatobacter sp. AB_2022a TaxID=3003134 RepID=UPI002286EEC3|nr:GSU2403 family nucleotidyltransferase fold protein [Phreatobacter sp. AB_2022a]MCZ0734310.1 GSU2403 family nucleotidyltransferase fold protein [Phreatobacter sp. AB_2022a]